MKTPDNQNEVKPIAVLLEVSKIRMAREQRYIDEYSPADSQITQLKINEFTKRFGEKRIYLN